LVIHAGQATREININKTVPYIHSLKFQLRSLLSNNNFQLKIINIIHVLILLSIFFIFYYKNNIFFSFISPFLLFYTENDIMIVICFAQIIFHFYNIYTLNELKADS